MNKIEVGLRNRIGSDHIIGCYSVDEDGMGCFVDIRGGEGDVIKNPFEKDKDLVIDTPEKGLEEGVFYSFKWALDENSSKFVIVSKPKKVNNKTFLQGLFDARLRLNGSNLELFNNFQKTIFNEVTGAQHTYIYELLQNANDYPFDEERVNVKFILTDNYLFFMHSGACFNLRNVVGISSVNQGEKKKNTETIGYKGIGFKTVFVNNEYVYLKSGDWSLRFDRKYSEEKFYGDCPWALMPIPTDISELDKEISDTLAQENMRVQFALKHKQDARKNIEQLDKVFSDNQILLFIPNVYKVDVVIDGNLKHSVEKDAEKWVVRDFGYNVPADLKRWVEDNINSGDKIPEKFKDIDKVRISFAVGRVGKSLGPVENARVYNYLPTELRLGFNFLFNADFVPNGSRSGLHDVNWNDCIMRQCGSQFADWWTSFLSKEGEFDLNSVFDILPDYDSKDKYAQLFIEGFNDRIQEIPCIPAIKDGKYHLVMLQDVIFDKINFIASPNPVLSDEEFYNFTELTGSLPHPSIRCHSKLRKLIEEYNCSTVFTDKDIKSLCMKSQFKNWLSFLDNDYKFIGFLLIEHYIMNFWEYEIFLSEDGDVLKADKLYYDIDKYINDIGFLAHDLQRINVNLRNMLSTNYYTWGGNKTKFKTFLPEVFVKNVFSTFISKVNLFEVKENNIGFIHFVAVENIYSPLPSLFPFYLDDETRKINASDIFIKNEIGIEVKTHPWINEEWVNFLHEDYFTKDRQIVENFLSSRCNIDKLTISECYNKFIAEEKNIDSITKAIQDKEVNIDFYRYLSEIQDSITNLKSSMRQSYSVFTTDGTNELLVPISRTIFKKDEDWEKTSVESWMPKECCLAISDVYFEGLSEDKSEKLHTLFSTKQIVQKFSIAGLYQSIRTRLTDIFSNINTKEISKDFLNFLFNNRNYIFTNDAEYSRFKSTPVKLKDQDGLVPILKNDGSLFLPNEEILELYNQSWFDKTSLVICDDYYLDLFDGGERRVFFIKLGFKIFDKIQYVKYRLIQNLDAVKKTLKDRNNNISFHRYMADIYESLSDTDMLRLKNMPVFISSPNHPDGILANSSSSHYMPSELLADIISKDILPVEILASIHPDYIKNDKDYNYFSRKLGNIIVDNKEIYSQLFKDSNSSVIKEYIRDTNRNIRFWRWICDSNSSKETKAKLNSYPMLAKGLNDESYRFEEPKNLFVSGAYSKNEALDSFINEHVENPVFVSSAYLAENDECDWISLFRLLRVTTDNSQIVFHNILPNLDKYKNTKIMFLLAEYADNLTIRLSQKDEATIKCINRLHLLCNDGIYRTPKDVVVTGTYFDIDFDLFNEIKIDNFVSEEYINLCEGNDSLRRNVIKLITAIADYYKVKVESSTRLRNYKIQYFITRQILFKDTEAHYSIISKIASCYNHDIEGVGELLGSQKQIKLFTNNNEFVESEQLYFSTIYDPVCQFMANGITTLRYVNDKYHEYNNDIKSFFHRIGIREYFSNSCLDLLKNEQFAIYFWGTYALQNEITLKNLLVESNLKQCPCIPSKSGIKKPSELYDYRNPQLNRIVRKLENYEDKLPAIEIPGWIDKIGFRRKLYLPDCLEYLTLETIDFRRDVYRWIVETPSELLDKNRSLIKEYYPKIKWYTGAKSWVSLTSLVALEWGNTTLKDNFGGNAFVCNPSYMPEYQHEYNSLCEIFNIKVLHNNDFSKKKAGEYRTDYEAVSEISKRLMFLAYKTGKDDWQELYNTYKSKLDNADISICERIEYSYNENIKTNLNIYAEDASALWYINSWQGPMFIAILDWIIKKLEVKGSFDKNLLERLFLSPFTKFVKEEEGGTLPQEIVECLNEIEQSEISIDNTARGESFNEETVGANELPEELKEKAKEEIMSRTKSVQTPNNAKQNNTYNEPAPSEDENNGADDSLSAATNGTNETTSAPQINSNNERPSNNVTQHQNHESKGLGQKYDDINTDNENQLETNDGFSRGELRNTDLSSMFSPASRPTSSGTNAPKEKTDDDKIDEIKQKLLEQEEKQNKANELREQADNSERYTKEWFDALLELEYKGGAENKSGDSSKSLNISFSRVSKERGTERIYVFSSPSCGIPQWVEEIGDIEVKCRFTNKDEMTLKFEVANVRESSLRLKASNAYKEILDKIDWQKFTTATITLKNQIDLMGKLRSAFNSLNLPEGYNLKENLTDRIKFIFGPPGTGKTYTLAKRIIQTMEKDYGTHILVLGPTNTACDEIARKIKEFTNDDCLWMHRFVSCADEMLEDCVVERESMVYEDDKCCVISTMARLSFDGFNGLNGFQRLKDIDWDMVICDEASMIPLAEIAFTIYNFDAAPIVIAGDPMQIPPIVHCEEWKDENIYTMIKLDRFDNPVTEPIQFEIENLSTQYRSLPAIGELFSQYSYDGQLKHARSANQVDKINFGELKLKQINFIPFKVERYDSVFGTKKLDGSNVHIYSVLLTVEYVKYIIHEYSKTETKEFSIGVVCPYSPQAQLIESLLAQVPNIPHYINVIVGTVHRFQGGQCNMIITVFNPPLGMMTANDRIFLNKRYILNVAVSRAQDYLCVLLPHCDTEGYRNLYEINMLGNIAQRDPENVSTLTSDQLEEILFGKKFFIENNTFVTSHQLTNVYSKAVKMYEVRIDEKSVDIQLGEHKADSFITIETPSEDNELYSPNTNATTTDSKRFLTKYEVSDISRDIAESRNFTKVDDYIELISKYNMDKDEVLDLLFDTETYCAAYFLAKIFCNNTYCIRFHWAPLTESDIKSRKNKANKKFLKVLFPQLYLILRSGKISWKGINNVKFEQIDFARFKSAYDELIVRMEKKNANSIQANKIAPKTTVVTKNKKIKKGNITYISYNSNSRYGSSNSGMANDDFTYGLSDY